MASFRAGLVVGALGGVALGLAAGWLSHPEPPVNPGVVGLEPGNAVHSSGPRSAPPPAETERRRVDPAAAGHRGHTTLRPPSTPDRAGAPTAPSPPVRPRPDGPYEDWSARQFLDELRRVAARRQGGLIENVLKALRKKHPRARVSSGLALDLVEARATFTYQLAVETFTDGELLSLARVGVNATPADLRSWALVWAVSRELLGRGLDVDAGVVLGLLSNETPRVRMAGLMLAGRDPRAFHQSIDRIARDDPENEARVLALGLLVDAAESEGAAPPDDLVALVGSALRTGNAELRRETVGLVPELGEPGARLALDLLASQAFAVGAEEAGPLVRAVVSAGLGPSLLARTSSPEALRAVGRALIEALDEERRDGVRPLANRFDEIAAALPEGEVEELYSNLAYYGFHPTVIRAALDRELDGERRRLAFESLWNAAQDEDVRMPEFAGVAERVAWDESASVQLRTSALEALRDDPETVGRGFEIERRILLEHVPPAALRAGILGEVGYGFDEDERVRRRPEVLALLAAVEARDPSSWVRAVAKETREQWEDSE